MRDIRSNITLCLKEILRVKVTPEGKGLYPTVYPKVVLILTLYHFNNQKPIVYLFILIDN